LADKIVGNYNAPDFAGFAKKLGCDYADICNNLFDYIDRFGRDGDIADRATDVAKTMYFLVGNLKDVLGHHGLRTAIATTAAYLLRKVTDADIDDLVKDAKALAMHDLINKGYKDVAAGITLLDYCDDNIDVARKDGFLVPYLDMP
jgi:hypothetical protein